MTTPLISIGLPVFNGAAYLSEAIDALLSQDLSDFELIISDNGSTDTTEEICRAYAVADSRVRYYRSDVNHGAAWNYNRVFNLARGQFFKWATHDDVCLPGYLQACVRVFAEAPPSLVLVYTLSNFVNASGATIASDSDAMEVTSPHASRRLAHILRHVNMANAIFGLIRTDALRKTRLIDSFIASDYVLLAELAMLGEFREVRAPLFQRRLHREGSRFANRTNEEVQRWFDPKRPLKFKAAHRHFPRFMVRLRLIVEWMRSAFQLPLGLADRLTCLLTIPFAYGLERLRCYGGHWKERLSRRPRSNTPSVQQ